MYIETERLIIRSIKPEDENAYIEMASDGSLHELFGDCSCCHEWMGDWIKEARKLDIENCPAKDYLAYAITEKSHGTILGSMGCSYYEDLKKIGITFFIGAAYRGKGYAAEAAAAYVNYFFGHYSVSEMIATVRADNIPSRKSVEKAGFALKEAKLYRDINDDEEILYRFYEQTALSCAAKRYF